MASSIITVPVIKGNIEELNTTCGYRPGHKMSGRLRHDEATSYRRREPRLDGFLFFNFYASVLKAWFLARRPILTVEFTNRFF